MGRPHRPLHHRAAAGFLAVWFALLAIAAPRDVAAVVVATIPILEQQAIREEIQRAMKDSFGFQLQLALVNAVQFFGQRLAYETAVTIASGGKAQSPLFDQRTWDDFLVDSAFGAGLQFVDDIDRAASAKYLKIDGGIGLAQYICAPTIPEVSLRIKLGLQDRLQPVQPLCSFQQIKDNWSAFTAGQGFRGGLARSLSGIGASFEPGETDLSAALELHVAFGEIQAQRTLADSEARREGGGWRPLQDPISGLTKTPASVVEDTVFKNVTEKVSGTSAEVSRAARESVASIDSLGPMFAAMGQALAVNFAATVVSQTIQRQVLGRGLFPVSAPRERGDNPAAAPPLARQQAALTAFSELQRPRFASAGTYDQLSELASCDPARRSTTTCAMDSGFAQAVRRAESAAPMTVAEATTAGLLHRDWPLLRSGTAKDQDPNCYLGPPAGGYCASNLAKLRRARIVPIGWELAANHEANDPGSPKLLGEIMDAFGQNGEDGACGTNDRNESPFCGLIDPNWILRYHTQQCRMRAPGELLLEQGSSVRADVCTDAPSCLEVDAEGRCIGGYGYCVRERNVWNIGGKSCPAFAASCRALTSATGQDLAVLTTTTDRGQCTAENAGCRWYATRRIPGADADDPETWVADAGRRYLNRNVEQCAAADEGCTTLVPVATARLNVVENGSFAADDDRNGVPDQWTVDTFQGRQLQEAVVVVDGFQGSGVRLTANDPNAANNLQQVITMPLTPGVPITASVKFFASAGVNGKLFFGDIAGNTTDNIVTPWDVTRTVYDGTGIGDEYVQKQGNGDWQTLAITVIPAAGATLSAPDAFQIRIYADNGTTVRYDEAQVEIGDAPTAFHEGYAPEAPRKYLKVAPPELRCADLNPNGSRNIANDHPSCAAFATACTADDVGCERFTPLDGSPVVTGRYTDADRCPASCVGYSAFQEVESVYDENPVLDYFIPSTARQCAAAEVGCSEFTNLDTLAAGGEAREYFTFLRRCAKPDAVAVSSATYYVWEGAQATGFTLQSFRLRSSTNDVNSAPWTPSCIGGTCAAADICDANYGKRIGEAGYDPVITPDCRAFYSQNGTIAYRRMSQTTIITDACTPYRLTHVVSEAKCESFGGTFDASSGCVVNGYRQESTQCTPQASGCRAYRGNASGAVRTLLAFDFEATSGDVRQGWSTGTQSSESLIVGGHSLELAANSSVSLAGPPSDGNPTTLLRSGSTYELLLVGKGVGQVSARINDGGQLTEFSSTTTAQSVTFGTSWQRITLGPLFFTGTVGTPIGDEALELTVSGGAVFLDTIILREVPQLATRIKKSWVTPSECDRASAADDAVPQARGMLGCAAYRDRANVTVTLRSFTKLCSADTVGCTAFYDTAGSSALGAEPFNDGGDARDDVTVPADTIRYLVDDPAKACTATAASCRKVGVPTLDRQSPDAEGVVTGWTSAYLKDNPDRYRGAGGILCTAGALMCEEYRGSDGSLAYFKDPGNRTCTFRENVTLSTGTVVSGWFRTGTDTACDENLVIGGSAFGIWRNADPQYAGWVGLCNAAHDQCAEFRDPTDRSASDPSGKPYYAIRDTVDLASCGGSASPKAGCVVLQDTARPNVSIQASATYAEGDARGGAAAPVVNCETNPAACRRCAVARACRAADGTPQDEDGNAANGITEIPCLSDNACDRPNGFACRGGEVGQTCTADAECSARGGPKYLNEHATCEGLANDGNVVVKVQRDRACGQWLACVSSTEVWDPSQRRLVEVCDRVDLCSAYRPGSTDSQSLQCARWVSGEETDGQVLTRTRYQQRDRSWRGQEYGGYAIPPHLGQSGVFQAADLSPWNLSLQRDRVDQRLVRIDDRCWDETGAPRSCTAADAPGTCDGEGDPPPACGSGGRGRCVNHRCVLGVDDQPVDLRSGVASNVIAPSCRAYPESTAPFTHTVIEEYAPLRTGAREGDRILITARPGYEQANVCAYGEGQCGCTYKKVRYANTTRYYRLDTEDVPEGLCDGGFDASGKPKELLRCVNDNACTDEREVAVDIGRCSGKGGREYNQCVEVVTQEAAARREHGRCRFIERRDRFLGVLGICLERDESVMVDGDPNAHPCALWYPVQQLAGGVDTYNQYEKAGFHETAQYCTESTRYEYRRTHTGESIPRCTVLAAGTACVLLCGGATNPLLPVCVASCMVEALAIGGVTTAAIEARDESANRAFCNDDPNYTYTGVKLDWGVTGCLPFYIPEVEFRCSPKGGDGWYADDEGNRNAIANEVETNICTEVARVANEPNEVSTNNRAATDLVRERKDAIEAFLLNTLAPGVNPREWSERCGRYGQLPPNVDPETVRRGDASAAARWWAMFADTNPPVPPPECGLPADGIAAAEFRNTDENVQSVAYGNRHFEGARDQLQRLFGAAQAIFRWTKTGAGAQCSNESGAKTGAACQETGGAVDQCTDSGICGRRVEGIAAPQMVCIKDPKCSNDANRTCRSNSDCVGGGRCVGVPMSSYATHPDYCANDAECTAPPQAPGLPQQPSGVCIRVCTAGAEWNACTTDLECNLTGQCEVQPPSGPREAAARFTDALVSRNWDVTSSGARGDRNAGVGVQPQIASATACTLEGKCAIERIGAFAVNGRSRGPTNADGGQATLRFYGWANRNQMPLVRVTVDWGDGTESGGVGKYQNHKPVCAIGDTLEGSVRHCAGAPELTCTTDADCPEDTGRCLGNFCRVVAADGTTAYTPFGGCTAANCGEGNRCIGETSFGDFPDACVVTPFVYHHSYRCAGPSDPYWDATENACAFIPRIRLIDNWDWCTGRSSRELPTHGLRSSVEELERFCDTDAAFVRFEGRVLVRP